MELVQSTSLLVKCPHCGNKFSPEEALGHDLRVQLEQEFELKLQENSRMLEQRIRKEEEQKLQSRFRLVEEDRNAKSKRVQELEGTALRVQQLEQYIREQKDRTELEMKRRLFEREKLIRDEAEKNAREKALIEIQEREQRLTRDKEQLDLRMKRLLHEETEKVREEERMKNAELQKKLDDQVRLVNEMKRKSEQGSMQMQGEVQELAIEYYLESTFYRDDIEEVSKGKRGGDCVHIVKDEYNRVCGRILYESKRTKHFSHDWIAKVKDDMRLQQADMGVIVTDAFPEGMTKFGEIDGIWVCNFLEFKALALLFRHHFSRIGEVLASQENRGDKMQLIYSYLTGNEFKQKLEASFEAYRDMQDDLNKEKTLMTSQWAKREKRLLKAMENLVSLYGDIRGMAGGAVQEIKALEISEAELLE
jgi:hypothetical protein